MYLLPGPSRTAQRQRNDRAVAYGLPAAAAAAATQTWFTPGQFSASGDISPFIRDAASAEVGWLWTHQTTGAGSASTEIARAVEVGAAWIVTTLGGSPMLAQRLFFTAIVVLAAVGATYFARALTSDRRLGAFCGLFAALSPLTLISAFNPVLIAPIGLIGLLGGMVLRHARGRTVRPAAIALTTLGLSYFGLNPPTLLMVVAAVLIITAAASLLVGPGGTRRGAELLLRAAPLALLMNVWWLVPVALAIFSSSGTAIAAETSITQWEWTHAHSSLLNVAALNAHWTWQYPEYLPAAQMLDQPWWIWLRLVVPAFALGAPVIATAERRRTAVVVAGLAVGLIVIGKGLHAPFGSFNLWLYEHVPGFWLLREPMNKVGPLLLMAYLVLVIIGVESLRERAARTAGRPARVMRALPLLLVAGLIYPWPLYTGAVVPTDRPLLPSARVEVPAEWLAAADLVNTDTVDGKVLMLPLNPYYQVTTSWGYHGVDTVAQQLIRRPVVQRLPGSYFSEADGYDDLLSTVERAVLDGRHDQVNQLLRMLGVSHVIVRHDLQRGPTGESVIDDAVLAENARANPGLEEAADLGVASVLRVAEADGIVRSAAHLAVLQDGAGAPAELDADILDLPASSVAGTGVEPAVDRFRSASMIVRSRETGTLAVEVDEAVDVQITRSGDPTTWQVTRDGAQIVLRELLQLEIDGRQIEARSHAMTLDDDGLLVVLSPTDDSTAPLVPLHDGDLIRLGPGDRVAGLLPTSTVEVPFIGPINDCNDHDDRSPEQIDLGGQLTARQVDLTAAAHSACVATTLPDGEDGIVTALSLRARGREGVPARMCVWSAALDRCAADATASTGQWTLQELVVRHDTAGAELVLYVYADGADDGVITRTSYAEASLRRFDLATADVITIDEPAATSATLSTGEHDIALTQALPDSTLSEFTPLGDCRRFDDRSAEQVGLRARTITDGIELSADDHSACVSTALITADLQQRYQLSLQHQTRSGSPARICVWNHGADACSDLAAMPAQDRWTDFRASVTPLADASGLEVFLYADGTGDGTTTTAYRDISLAPSLATAVTVEAQGSDDAEQVDVAYVSRNPATYNVAVDGAADAFVLVLAEAFDRGWELRGVPPSWRVEHVEVDGYANGWLLEARGSSAPAAMSLTAVHAPSMLARQALWVSLAAVVAGMAWLVATRRRQSLLTAAPVLLEVGRDDPPGLRDGGAETAGAGHTAGIDDLLYSYAWWLSGAASVAWSAVRGLAVSGQIERDDLASPWRQVRAAIGEDRDLRLAAEVALLHDRLDVPLSTVADVVEIDTAQACSELAAGRIEALDQPEADTFTHPDRLGGLATGDLDDLAHAMRCSSCATAEVRIMAGRQAIVDLPDPPPPPTG